MPSWRSCFSWPLKRWYATLVNRCALGAFAQGDCAARDFVSWGIRPTKIAHLYYAVNGVSADQTVDAPTRDFVAGRNAFVYVGTLNHNKASLLLLRAFAESCQDSQTCLVLVGRGPAEQQCRHFVRAHHLERQVFFRGVVPYDQVGSVMRTCRVLVLPSRYDGWGVVMNEGASAGLALVASEAVGAAHQLIQHEQNGFRVKTADTASLAAALAKYAHNHPLAALHGQRSLRLFQESFTPEANVARFVAAVQRWKELPRHPGAFSATAESTPPTQLAADETRRAA